MNLGLLFIFVVSTHVVLSFEKKTGYHDMFANINKQAKLEEVIQNSPNAYAKFAETISKSTDLRSFSRTRDLNVLASHANVLADNTTEVPVTGTTMVTTNVPTKPPKPQPTVSELCQTHIEGVLQGISQGKMWALKSKWLCL